MFKFLLTAVFTVAAGLSIFAVRTPPGIGFIQENSPTASKYLIETMGAGSPLLITTTTEGWIFFS